MIITFLLAFGFYLITLCPTVYVGDSGEFATAAYTLGITHPPGYPLYVLLGKIFTLVIPFGNIAYRVNTMSAFLGAMTCSIVYKIVSRKPPSRFACGEEVGSSNDQSPLTAHDSRLPAFIAAMALAFSQTFWSQSVVAEVYTLNAFFIALLIYISTNQQINKSTLLLFSFLAGVGIAGHYTVALLMPAFLVLYRKELFEKKKFFSRFLTCFVFFFMGLSVLLFMHVRSSAEPFMDWGNTEIFQNFIAQIRRVQYKTFEFGQTVTILSKLRFMQYFLKLAGQQFTYYLLPLVLLGLIVLWKSFKRICIFTIVLFLINSIGLLSILKFQFNPQQASVVEVYFLPAYTVMAVWLGYGLIWLSNYIKPVFLILFLALPVTAHFNYNNKRENFIAYDYSSNILKSLPGNAHFFSSGDNQMFLLSYQQWCLKKRRDASFYTDTGLLFKNVFGDDFFQLTKEQKQKRRADVQRNLIKQPRAVCFSLGSSVSNLRDVKSEISGIIFRAKPAIVQGREPNYDLWNFYAIREIDNKNFLNEYLLRDVSAQYHYFLAEKYFLDKNVNKMLSEFDTAARTGGDVEWVYNNIGISLREKKMPDEAIARFNKGIEINPYDENMKTNLAFIYLTKGFEKFQQNNFVAAINFYLKSAETDPQLAEPHNYLGVIYEQMNQHESAIAEYKKAIDLRYDYVDAHYNLGVVYWKLNNWGEVRKEFETVLQLEPAHPQAGKYLAVLGNANTRK